MNMEIKEEKANPFLKRKEIIVNLTFDNGTPSKAVVQELIAKNFSTEKENVEVSKIISDVGKCSGKSWVKIWDEKKAPVYKTKESEKQAEKKNSDKEAAEKESKEKSKPIEAKSEKKEEPKKEETKKEVDDKEEKKADETEKRAESKEAEDKKE